MEEDRPVSVEVIYDRIVRRGSIVFFSYRRPFRAISLVLSTMAKRGEVILLIDADGSRLSRRIRRQLWQRAAL